MSGSRSSRLEVCDKPVATEPAAGIDLLAFDEQSGRAVVLCVTGETVEWQISRALGAAADA